MKILNRLDKKETEAVDISPIVLSANMGYDKKPDETIFFKMIIPCANKKGQDKK